MAARSSLRIVGLCLIVVLLGNREGFAQVGVGGGVDVGGIRIDAEGLVSAIAPLKETPAAAKKRMAAYEKSSLAELLGVSSESRRVSLRQLDELLASTLKAGGEIPPELKYLAGVTRIDYIVIDRENNDLAIVGPAEGFAPDTQGRMRGINSGRPVLNLEDLLVAWRAVETDHTSVTCSIDPTPEGITAFNAFASQNQVAKPNTVGKLFDTMAKRLGRQVISVNGVPKDTHFGVVLVEADLRMKRIALGKDPSQVKGVTSQLQFQRSGGSTLSRWWFTPLYDSIEANEDRSLYRLSGQRLQLLAQDEFTNAQGNRSKAPFTKQGSNQFARQFTDHFPELAVSHPVFAELQNLFDWMVVCTLIRNHQLDESIHWKPAVLGNSTQLPTQVFPAPDGVDAVAMTNRVGQTVFGLVGGVELNAREIVLQTARLETAPSHTIPMRHASRPWND